MKINITFKHAHTKPLVYVYDFDVDYYKGFTVTH